MLDFSRIAYLLNPPQFAQVKITGVGCGSGGVPVYDHLTMNGLRRWDLYDPDTLNAVNLVKHPRMRRDIGRPKVQIQKEWILDRNPDAEVNGFVEDVVISPHFRDSVRGSDLVLSCSDQVSVREFVSDICVQARVPFVVGSVFRTGIGGEIFAYVPGETGCFRCLQILTMEQDLAITDEQLGINPGRYSTDAVATVDLPELTREEEEQIYGLDDRTFQASGLSIDIHMISLIQARMALSLLLRGSTTDYPRFKGNWIVFGNRPKEGVFSRHFETKILLLRPQKACTCWRS